MYAIKNSGQGKQPLKKPSHRRMNAAFGSRRELLSNAEIRAARSKTTSVRLPTKLWWLSPCAGKPFWCQRKEKRVISHQLSDLRFSPLITGNTPQLPLGNNYWQPEIRSAPIILSAFCQKNFFFAIKLHKKKIIVVGEIDSFTRLN